MALVDPAVAADLALHVRRLTDCLIGYVEAGDARNVLRTLFLIDEAVSPTQETPIGRTFIAASASSELIIEMFQELGEFPPELLEICDDLKFKLTARVEGMTGKPIDVLREEIGLAREEDS